MKKYEEIINDIIYDMRNGSLKKGDKIDSIRALSKNYECNKDTVLKALSYLSKEQLIYSIPKKGYFILKDISELNDDINDNESFNNEYDFPFNDFSLCINQVITSKNRYMFSDKAEGRGLSDLNNSLHKLLSDYNVYAKKEQIFVSSGAQQAFYILAKMDFDTDREVILLEQPTYNRMNKLVKELNLPYKTIERKLGGIDLEELEKIFKTGEIKFFYTIPRLHYPLGIGYTEKEKKSIVRLADKYDVFVLEDDYMADFDRSSSLPLHYYDVADKVIYIKSFSSIVFNSLRIAVLVLPNSINEKFFRYKKLMDYETNLVLQKAFSIYIDNGMFHNHRNKLINIYEEKNRVLIKTLENLEISSYSVFDTTTIFRIKNKKDVLYLKSLLSNKYKIDFLEDCYIDSCPYKYIKIDVKKMNLVNINDEISNLIIFLEPYVV